MSDVLTEQAQPVVLTVSSTGQGDYSVSHSGTVLANGRRALTTALSALRLEGMAEDAFVVVHNVDTGAQSEPFTLLRYPEMRRDGNLPLPRTRQEQARRGRIARSSADHPQPPSGRSPACSVENQPAGLPPLNERSTVWIDQRAKKRIYP